MRDVFLSYNHADKAQLTRIYEILRARGVDAWFDDVEIAAGDNFLEKMDEAINDCHSCAVFVGSSGLGRHQTEELWSALSKRFRSDAEIDFRVVPVLLPGVGELQLEDLPSYLNYYSHIAFQRSVEDEDEPIERLVRSIRRSDLVELTFDFEKTEDEESYRVNLQVDGHHRAAESLAIDVGPDSRTHSTVQRINAGTADGDVLADVGVQLWSGITAGSIREFLKKATGGTTHHVRLRLPPELEWLPWETLYDEHRSEYLASDERYSIIRDLSHRARQPDLPPHSGESIKLVIAGPAGDGVDYPSECKQIAASLSSQLKGAVSVSSLESPVTLEQIDGYLARNDCDVLHFVGHGRLTSRGAAELRFNTDQPGVDQWVDSDTFASVFRNRRVRLVVLNCCHSGGAVACATRSGLGPALLMRGVPAVIAMQFPIKDDIALGFSRLFYENLVSNPLAGRIDFALQQTRRTLRYRHTSEEPRAFVTPQLFLARGYEHLLRVHRPYQPPVPVPGGVHTGSSQLPKDLHEAIADRLCVPVVGPGILTAGSLRRATTDAPDFAPGPHDFVARLSSLLRDQYQIPSWDDELRSRDRSGEWLDIVELQRACQFFVDCLNRAKVVKAIAEIHERVERPPDSMLLLAEWPVSAVICTYFDGLMERALLNRKREISVVTSIDGEVEWAPEATLLVHVRGTWQTPRDLVLTEREEHDLLWNRFANANGQISSLLSGEVGRSPLFIGCDPRAMLVRRLGDHLMPTGTKNLGDVFFVTPSGVSPVDSAYWKDFPASVQWVECGTEAAVNEVSERLRGR